MKFRFSIFGIAFTLLFLRASAQEIDNTASWKNINSASYIRLYVDNDYFTGTDEQYTEGLNLEICMPWVRKFPLSKLLVHPRFNYIRYGIGIEQAGYTPFDLPSETLPTNGRPFAGAIFLKTFLIATDTQKHQRFSTTLSTGAIGPVTNTGNLQDAVHIITANVQPPGWKYQVQNDVALNYQVNYEKQLFSLRNLLVADAEGMARGGTLSDKAAAGINIMAGHFDSPFSNIGHPSKFQIYVFDNPELQVIGYDATMEGGVFNRSSPYTIPPNNISRIVFLNSAGLAITIHHWQLAYDQYYLTKQFSTGPYHLWGGVQVALSF